MTDLPFVSALVQADLPVWEQCLQAEFLQKMENGTLSEDCFKSYLVEDSLYLREYAKIFAWGMTKATTMAAFPIGVVILLITGSFLKDAKKYIKENK